MFTKEKNPASEKQSPGGATLISAGTNLNGDVTSENDLRIDGTIKGNIKCSSKIIIGPTGFVDGNIESAHADITGKVQGNVVVKEFLPFDASSLIIPKSRTAYWLPFLLICKNCVPELLIA